MGREWRALDLSDDRKTRKAQREEHARTERLRHKAERSRRRRAEAEARKRQAQEADVSDFEDDLAEFEGDATAKEAERKRRQTLRRVARREARECARIAAELEHRQRRLELQRRALSDRVVPLPRPVEAPLPRPPTGNDQVRRHEKKAAKRKRRDERRKTKGVAITLSEFHLLQSPGEHKGDAVDPELELALVASAVERCDGGGDAKRSGPRPVDAEECKTTTHAKPCTAAPDFHSSLEVSSSALASVHRARPVRAARCGVAPNPSLEAASSSASSSPPQPPPPLGVWVRLSGAPTRVLCLAPCCPSVTVAALGDHFKAFGNVRSCLSLPLSLPHVPAPSPFFF